MAPSSRGLGHLPFTEVTGIRIPLELIKLNFYALFCRLSASYGVKKTVPFLNYFGFEIRVCFLSMLLFRRNKRVHGKLAGVAKW